MVKMGSFSGKWCDRKNFGVSVKMFKILENNIPSIFIHITSTQNLIKEEKKRNRCQKMEILGKIWFLYFFLIFLYKNNHIWAYFFQKPLPIKIRVLKKLVYIASNENKWKSGSPKILNNNFSDAARRTRGWDRFL